MEKTTASMARQGGDTSASGLADLAHHAMAQVCAQARANGMSEAAKSALGDPLPTALAYALCDEDDTAANLIVDDLFKAGLSVEDVCLEHLAPAARRLGEWWEKDRLPFTEVTVASARIQALLRRMPNQPNTPLSLSDKGAFFASVPGEQHTLGVMMAADMFRRAGWDVGLMVGQSHDEIVSRLARDDRPVIGLSCSGDHSFPALKRLMTALRKNRPNAHVLLSGQIVHHADRLADLPQPFTTVTDAVSAEVAMRHLEDDLAMDAAMSAHERRG